MKILKMTEINDFNVSYVADYDNGRTMTVYATREEYEMIVFKLALIEKGYDEKDLDKLIDLVYDCTYRDQSDNDYY